MTLSQLTGQIETIEYTTVIPGSGGHSGGWRLEDLSIPVPARVMLPNSIVNNNNQPLSDPDLFLHTIDIQNISIEVEESLRESVRCFSHELYLACLTMLGKASEGAWIELGLSLATMLPPDELEKSKIKLEDPFVGIGKKIVFILQVYEKKDLFKDIYIKSEVRIQDLRNAVIWSDAVRDSRNSIHYGVKPAMPNSYEKVAALLIGAVPHIKLLYKIINAINI